MAQREPAVPVADLLGAPSLADAFQVFAGRAGLTRFVRRTGVQPLGVAMTGYTGHLQPDRLLLVGRAEHGYLDTLPGPERSRLLATITSRTPPAVVVTSGLAPHPELAALADERAFVLVTTELSSRRATADLEHHLIHHLVPRFTHHGVLVDVHGVGVLIQGRSGVGKSEVALELVAAGHRLVADDLILLQEISPGIVVGAAAEVTRFHMEIRGLGIINARDLFGAGAVRRRKRVELLVELVEWDPAGDYDRLGLDTRHSTLAGVPIEHLTLPVRPGRSLRLIIEVAARNRLLRAQGTHSARDFAERTGRLTQGEALPPEDPGLPEGDVE